MADGFLLPSLTFRNPGTNDDHRFDPFAERDKACCKLVTEVLQAHYLGHPWKVEVSHEQGVAKIQIPVFMGPTNWWVIHIATLKEYEAGKRAIIRAGGDILERFNIPRLRFDRDHFLNALKGMPTHRRFHGYVPS